MIALSLLLLAAGGPEIPVAFWRTGDDGLSARFYKQIEKSVADDAHLRAALATENARFALYAESNVVPLGRDSGRFAYRISLREGPEATGRILARFDGKCLGTVSSCADRLVTRVAKHVVELSQLSDGADRPQQGRD